MNLIASAKEVYLSFKGLHISKNETKMVLKFIFFACILLTSCTKVSLNEYLSKNQAEREIISLLIRYQEAKNSSNIEQFLSLLHEQGQYSFFGKKVSKTALKQRLPATWAKLKAGEMPTNLINHEQITGNYFRNWKFYNPKITIVNNMAIVTVMVQFNWWWGLRHSIRLFQENGRWMISALDWETV